jgi:hypothetical protein
MQEVVVRVAYCEGCVVLAAVQDASVLKLVLKLVLNTCSCA